MDDQSYPDATPGGPFPSGTGAIQFVPFDAFEGVPEQFYGVVLDSFIANGVSAPGAFSVYRINAEFSFAIPDPEFNCCLDVFAQFESNGGSFGIDNVIFSTTQIPEPSTALTLAMGLLVLGPCAGPGIAALSR